MLSLAQALDKRGTAGTPLPAVYPRLSNAGVEICKSQLSLIVGPPSAGKSTLAMNLLAKWDVPSLAFLLDTNELTASCRFLSVITGDDYRTLKTSIVNGEDRLPKEKLAAELPMIRAVFHASDPDDIRREIKAFEQRFGLPPDVVLVDNLGNLASLYENEWATLKALTLELDGIAREAQCAVIGTAHTTDLDSCEPAQRTKILGKISQYPRLILSVGYNDATGEFKVAVVKNTEGKTDGRAERPLIFHADPARMQISESPLKPSYWQGSYPAPWAKD